MQDLTRWSKLRAAARWIPDSVAKRALRRPIRGRPVHLILSLADHFEPSILPGAPGQYAPLSVQEERLERWCREYPGAVGQWRDADGCPFRHTYFYPAEQYNPGLVQMLARHCQAGWGEVEIQLHHGVSKPDTAVQTRQALTNFRDQLVLLGCLSRWDGKGNAQYAFVHGNWALANSLQGRCCGVDEEIQILSETGCYGDFTLPSAPSPAQISKTNSLYECGLPLSRRAAHRSGRALECGRAVEIFPLMVQGPLLLRFSRNGKQRLIPNIENAEISTANPPSLERLQVWRDACITVRGRPEWVFVKLHCHGMDPRDERTMLGDLRREFLSEITEAARREQFSLHFVSAREMVNIILAACDGREGKPGDFRDYRLRPITTAKAP